jgi:hypothetical protein
MRLLPLSQETVSSFLNNSFLFFGGGVKQSPLRTPATIYPIVPALNGDNDGYWVEKWLAVETEVLRENLH